MKKKQTRPNLIIERIYADPNDKEAEEIVVSTLLWAAGLEKTKPKDLINCQKLQSVS